MTTLIGICGQPLVHALGWTLLHLCWQGTLVAAVLWCVLKLLGDRPSQARYAASCLALGLMVALPLATFVHLASKEYRLRAAFDGPAVVIAPGMTLQVGAGDLSAIWPMRTAVALDHALPWILLAWLAGVLFFAARLNVGLMVARRMKSAGTAAPPAELQQVFDGLRRRLGIGRAVRLMHSALVQAPTVIGWLRPVVLIPVSCLTGLSAMQIEAVLAHELAHIQRHDYLVSVMQSVVEALLFYHPAVWWVSKQVRRERECCCDQLAVAVGCDRQAYARALLLLAERRSLYPEVALGANGGVLTMRIRRLLGCKQDSAASQLASIALLAVLVLAGGAVAVRLAHAQDGAAQTNSSASISTQVAVEPAGATQSPVGDAAQEPADGPHSPLPAAGQRTTSDTERQIDNAQRQLQVVQTKLNSEQFKKQMQDAQRQLQDAQKNPNSPEFKRQMQDAQQELQVWQEKLNSEQFKKQMQDAQRQLQDAQKNPNSPEFKRQMQDAQQELQVWQEKLNSEQFKKQIEDAQKKLNSEQFKEQIAQLLAQNTMIAKASSAPSVAQSSPHAVSAAPGAPLHVSAGTIMGNLIHKVDPVYPPIAKAAHVQGVVVLHVTISKTGTVEHLTVVSGAQMLRASARDAVSRWKYKPYLLNGQPTEVETTISVHFDLNDAAKSEGQSAPVELPKQDGDPVMQVGGDVSAPVPIYQPAPEYTPEARKAKQKGIVLVGLIVDPRGLPQNVHVLHGLGNGLDEKAVEAVQHYKFKPAMEHGKPVPVYLNVEVNFQTF